MAHHVSIHQLTSSENGRAFLNVDEKCPGGICVWGSSFQSPVYLLLNGTYFVVVVFDTEAFANEWLQENADGYENVFHIAPYGLIDVTKDWINGSSLE